jgi:hypothetical protein
VARAGLSKSEVQRARDQLIAEGRYPSADAVRATLGNTGSKSTIHRYLKELGSEDSTAYASRRDTERSLQALIEQVSAKLHADAEERLRCITARYENTLRRKEAEIAELHEVIAKLTSRLDPPTQREDKPTPPLQGNFGPFGRLAFISRSGPHCSSAFSIMLDSDRSTVPDASTIRPPGLQSH